MEGVNINSKYKGYHSPKSWWQKLFISGDVWLVWGKIRLASVIGVNDYDWIENGEVQLQPYLLAKLAGTHMCPTNLIYCAVMGRQTLKVENLLQSYRNYVELMTVHDVNQWDVNIAAVYLGGYSFMMKDGMSIVRIKFHDSFYIQ